MARKVIYKENGLLNSSDAPIGYRYLGYDGTALSEKTGSVITAIVGGGGDFLPLAGGTMSGDITLSGGTMSGTLYFGDISGTYGSIFADGGYVTIKDTSKSIILDANGGNLTTHKELSYVSVTDDFVWELTASGPAISSPAMQFFDGTSGFGTRISIKNQTGLRELFYPDADGTLALSIGGLTVNRPSSPTQFSSYFDTNLGSNGKLITYNGSDWIDGAGSIV